MDADRSSSLTLRPLLGKKKKKKIEKKKVFPVRRVSLKNFFSSHFIFLTDLYIISIMTTEKYEKNIPFAHCIHSRAGDRKQLFI